MKISCNIIQDLLPLYHDEVCSEDSKKIIEEHLNTCDNCSNYLEEIGNENFEENITINIENPKVNSLKKLNKEFFKKKVKIAIISILSVIATFLIFYPLIFKLELPIIYKEGLINVENIKDNKIQFRFSGKDFYKSHHLQQVVEVDGNEKNIVMIYYSNTLWSKISPNQTFISNTSTSLSALNYGSVLGISKKFDDLIIIDENIDAVYYLVEDYFELNLSHNKNSNDYLDKATLLWEK